MQSVDVGVGVGGVAVAMAVGVGEGVGVGVSVGEEGRAGGGIECKMEVTSWMKALSMFSPVLALTSNSDMPTLSANS